MTSTTFDELGHAPAGGKRAGFLRRVLAGMMEARLEEARLHVNAYLLSQDDATLASLGFDRKALERRAGRPCWPL